MFRLVRSYWRQVLQTDPYHNFYLQLSPTNFVAEEDPSKLSYADSLAFKYYAQSEIQAFTNWAEDKPALVKAIVGRRFVYILCSNYRDIFVDEFIIALRSQLQQSGRISNFRGVSLYQRARWVHKRFRQSYSRRRYGRRDSGELFSDWDWLGFS